MKQRNSPGHSGIMDRLDNRKGFSLIELAIVLVIIGIIVVAILKGNDLLFNSRTKQFISTTNAWKIAAYAFMDRRNRFPGDVNKNGNIGDELAPLDETAAGNSAIDETASKLSDAPVNPVLIGGQGYWFYFGSMALPSGKINVMVICPSVDCKLALSPSSVEMFSTLDTSIDGTADAGVGLLRGLAAAPVGTAGHGVTVIPVAAGGGRANGVVNALIPADLEDATPDGALAGTKPWAVGQFGAVWAFDNKF
jgi:prepilin-type N-terminal cleavage/methylation domain-containing protein